MKTALFISMLFLFQLIITSQIYSQKIEIQESEEKPYLLNTEGEEFTNTRGLFSRKSKKKLNSATSTYILVHPGPNGKIDNLSASDLARTGLQKELKFPSLYFTVSAASKLLIDDTKEDGMIKGKLKSFTELRQMCLRVKVQGYDKEKKIINRLSKSKFGDDPIIVLSIFPSDTSYGQTKQPGFIKKTSDKVDAIAQHLGPLGGLAHSITAVFRTFFPAKDHISQIAYMDSVNAFGWIWREAEGSPIEGIHKCMALIRAHKEVKYLKVSVEIITDWRRFGAWVKSYDYFIPVKGDNEL